MNLQPVPPKGTALPIKLHSRLSILNNNMLDIITIALILYILYFLNLLGFGLKKINLIMILITIELLILSLVLILTNLSFFFHDLLGGLIALILLPLSGSESAIGLLL